MITYALAGFGYRIFDQDGKPWIDVLGDPEGIAEDGVLPPFPSTADAEAHAIRTIAEITATASATE